MKPLTREWLEKAEADLETAGREQRAERPNYDAATFHAQQASEKFIKAVLCERNITFRKTHDVALLARLIDPPDLALDEMAPELERLNVWAVEVRYPGFRASSEDARRADTIAQAVRHIALRLLPQG